MATKAERLNDFVAWVQAHLVGDEKGEAQLYLDRLFQAFGWKGLIEAGATCELRVKKDNGGTAFADLVWKPIVLIEMKKRGEDLSKHYRQAFDYWTRIVPGRPRYAVLCNFDQLWVYDFENQMDRPVDQIRLIDLPARYGPLAFLFPENETPVFGNHHSTVTRQAADKLAACYSSLHSRKGEEISRRFILQMLMALFAGDIGLIERYFINRLLKDMRTAAETFDVLGGLFEAMNTPAASKGGKFAAVPYFNGGLFALPARVELNIKELNLLREAADFDWSKVSPEIFGTLFEHCLDADERSAFGAHFTNVPDIMKIITPTIVLPWREAIEAADTLAKLRNLLYRLQNFRVLDPACGSGNFLYMAYREVKRLEARIYERMAKEYRSVNPNQRPFGFVSVRNFFGIDLNPVAVEIARVTMMLAQKMAIDELHVTESPLPLDNLNQIIVHDDALLSKGSSKTIWPKVDVIIGNPPFLGAKKIKPARGGAYSERLRTAYPEIPGMADYCVYWFRRAHQHLDICSEADPFSGRAGLVGTQNIRNSQHRVGGLDFICATGTIVEAVDNQPWSGEANVNVSIVNWIKSKSTKLVPSKKNLWSVVPPPPRTRKVKPIKGASSTKRYELELKSFKHINASLTGGTDTGGAVALGCNTRPQRAYQGITPGHSGFVLTIDAKNELLKGDQSTSKFSSSRVIFPYLIGSELVTKDGKPHRYLIDFQPLEVEKARNYKKAYARVEQMVLPDRENKAKSIDGEKVRSHHKGFLESWWRLSWERSEMIEEIARLDGRYIVCSRVTKRPIFAFVNKGIRPGDRLQTFMFDDDYSFGILQSGIHWVWFTARCPKQTERFIYTTEDVFDTFPWPQAPTKAAVLAVAKASRKLRAERERLVGTDGLRGLYKGLELPGKSSLADAHKTLDEAVAAAYGISLSKDVLRQLLDLNAQVAASFAAGVPTQGPGLPSALSRLAAATSVDCIKP